MTKYERRQFFERLVQLRAMYRLRGSDDFAGVMSIDEAPAYVARLMDDALELAEVLATDHSRP